MNVKIHLGDAGRGRLVCPAKPNTKCPADWGSNWTWKTAQVTCKRCLAIRKRELEDQSK